MDLTKYPRYLSKIYGSIVTVALIVYFFIIYWAGLIHVTELRLLNIAIYGIGIYLALKQFKRTHKGHLNFLRGISIGMMTTVISSASFALFIFIYLKIDTHLMTIIKDNATLGVYLDPYIASFSIMTEGFVIGSLATFILINAVKTDQE